MDGLISRQAAIAEIARWIGYIDEDMILRIQAGLKKLPSVQPEREKGNEKCSNELPCGWCSLFDTQCFGRGGEQDG